ncbi:MAG: hypothetical protein HY842_05850 [Bacteroidetes bacterium]|nr:hypothetical protein [Bacteroidota bacterium]
MESQVLRCTEHNFIKNAEGTGLSYDKATFGRWLLPFNGGEVTVTGHTMPLAGRNADHVLLEAAPI